jgi:hypothetical protein
MQNKNMQNVESTKNKKSTNTNSDFKKINSIKQKSFKSNWNNIKTVYVRPR